MKRLFLSMGLVLTLTISAQINLVPSNNMKELLSQDLSQKTLVRKAIIPTGMVFNEGISGGNGIAFDFGGKGDSRISILSPSRELEGIEYVARYSSEEVSNLAELLRYLETYYDPSLYNGELELISTKFSNEVSGENLDYEPTKYLSASKNIINEKMRDYQGDMVLQIIKLKCINTSGSKNIISLGICNDRKVVDGKMKYTYWAVVNVSTTKGGNSNSNEEGQEDASGQLSDEYTEAEFQGEEEIEYKVAKNSLGYKKTNDNEIRTTNNNKTSRPSPKKLAPSMKGITITEKSMIGKWRASNGGIFLFMYGKVEIYPANSQMVDAQTTYRGNGVIWLSAWGMLISQLQVISKTPSTMILYNMETGAKINFSKY